MNLTVNTHQITYVAQWVVAIENYIANHTLLPRCPETDWKHVITLNDVRHSVPSLKGTRISFDIERLIEKTLEERNLSGVHVSAKTGKILFQHK